MLEWLCFIIFNIFTAAASPQDLTFSKDGDNHKSVNLALETILEFNEKDKAIDIKFLDNVYNFIDKVKTAINKKNILRRHFSESRLEKFTDFILMLIKILNKYEDKEIEYFVAVTSEELRKYHYKGCKFHELIDNYDLRKYIANKLDEFKRLPGVAIKERLIAIANKIKEENYDKNEKEFIDFMNSLYRNDSIIDTFNNILLNLDDYRLKTRRNLNFENVVSNGVKSILFDFYTNLNINARATLKSKLDDYTQQVIDIKTLLRPNLYKSEKIFKYTTKSTSETYPTKSLFIYDETTSNIQNVINQHVALRIRGQVDEEDNLNSEFYQKAHKHKKEKAKPTEAEEKKISFLSLYPAFVANWNTPEPIVENVDLNKITKSRKNKHSTKKAKETRTLRQMYIEKNLDLKYDPYAYDHFTTQSKNKIRKGKTTVTNTYDTKNLRQQTKSKRFKLVTMKPYVSPIIQKFDKYFKHELVSNKPAEQSIENAKQRNHYEIILKPQKIHSKKPKTHLKKPIVPMKEPKQNIGHPIGILMDDIPKLSHKLKTSTTKYHTIKLYSTVSTVTTNQDTPSKEDVADFVDNITERGFTEASLIITKSLWRKRPITVPTVTVNEQPTTSKEDKFIFEDYLTDKPQVTSEIPHINEISSTSPNPTYTQTRSPNEEAAMFENNISLVDIRKLEDASDYQIKLLAADLARDYTESLKKNKPGFEISHKEGFKEVKRKEKNRRSNSDHKSLDQNILSRLQNLENELKVVKTQIKNDVKTIKELRTIVKQKEQERKHSKHDFIGHTYKENYE